MEVISALQFSKETVCEFCKNAFKKDDDIVVCPICGAPYHRTCYNENSKCIYEDVHGTDLDYFHKKNKNKKATNEQSNSEKKCSIICRKCLCANLEDTITCKNCGAKLNQDGRNNEDAENAKFPNFYQDISENIGKEDFNKRVFSKLCFEAEENFKEELDDGITLGDIAKFTFSNSQYYVDVFKKIKNKNRSKFNFCAFWFPAAWFLYRKQYKLGVLLLVLSCAVSIITAFIRFNYINGISKILFGDSSIFSLNGPLAINYLSASANFSKLSMFQQIVFFVPVVCEALTIAVMLISGAFANRFYYKYCLNKIKNLKNNGGSNYQSSLLKEGGVNTKALSLTFVCYLLSQYLPSFFMK